jgi:predicted DNA-binding transcriptional regulator AlpA
MAGNWITRLVDAPAEDLLSAADICKLFSISDDTLDRIIAAGEFPAGAKVGKKSFLWDWRAVAFYRLRLELTHRLNVAVAKPESPEK